ncbi:MAG: hypothetical protein IKF91_04885 [Bacilli bacterium]|nr:hypothetical protein [Bacilli bacterium]
MKFKSSYILGLIIFILNIVLSHLFYSESNSFTLSTILIIIDIISVGILCANKKEDKKLYFIIFLGLIIRTLLMYFELYGRNIYILPNSGRDTEAFYKIPFTKNFGELNGYFLFVKILALLFCKQRLMFQFFNVFLSTLVPLIILKIFNKLELGNKAKLIGITLACLLPSNMIISSELLREELMIFINTCSLYFLIKWYKKSNSIDFIISILLLVLSSYFHSSMIISIFGYFFAYIFLNKNRTKIIVSYKTVGKLLFSIIIFIILYRLFYSYINSYFLNIGDLDYLNDKLSYYTEGNSVYLSSFAHISSFTGLIITSPIKFIYLYSSPVPWEWKGFTDILIFMCSSIFYIYPYLKFYKYKKNKLITILIIIVTIIGFTYGLSCFSTGSAMRHREKAFPYFCLLIPLLINEKGDKNEI